MTLLLISLFCVAVWAALLYLVHREHKRALKLNTTARKAFECAAGMLVRAQQAQIEAERLLRAAQRIRGDSEVEKFRRCYMVMN